MRRLPRVIVSVFGASTLAATSAAFSEPSEAFRWGGKTLDEYSGANASEIRQTYQPIIDKYPDLSACIVGNSIDQGDIGLAASDIKALPSFEAKEVCAFYDISRYNHLDDIAMRIVHMGFTPPTITAEPGRGHYITASWSGLNGSIMNGLLKELAQNVFGGSTMLQMQVEEDGTLSSLRILAKSRLSL